METRCQHGRSDTGTRRRTESAQVDVFKALSWAVGKAPGQPMASEACDVSDAGKAPTRGEPRGFVAGFGDVPEDWDDVHPVLLLSWVAEHHAAEGGPGRLWR